MKHSLDNQFHHTSRISEECEGNQTEASKSSNILSRSLGKILTWEKFYFPIYHVLL